jgi:NADP-dependent 3-hydroxy-3-methylglutaryl-CoA reductase
MTGKRIFHRTRQPSAVFMYGSNIYSGKLAGFWDKGLEIYVTEPLSITIGAEIFNINIGENGSIPPISCLEIVRLLPIESFTILEIACIDQSSSDELAKVLYELTASNKASRLDTVDDSRIPRSPKEAHYTEKAVEQRLEWIRNVSGSKLDNIAKSTLNPESLAGNIENYIGATQIPVGLAGPIMVKGTHTEGFVSLPIATTEGALVSSISRGAKACSLAGGIHVHVARQNMVRAPVFFCDSLEGAVTLERWVCQNESKIREKAESVSSVARLEQIRPLVFGCSLHLKFCFTTGDAAGQNMTSACTWIACEWIAEKIQDEPFIDYLWYNIEANMSGDKKANHQNFIEGRGISVTASCFISGNILRRILRVTPEKFVRIMSEAEFSAHQIGMMGSNINFSNVVAGVFTATGQDIACVHESAGGIFKATLKGNGLLFTAYLPSLVAGTVGGGTKLPVQRECLEIMGCYGQGKLFRFAEIIAAGCLALDISTGAAIFSNDFVSAHERLGRNRPKSIISRSEINESFFTDLIDDKDTTIVDLEKVPRLSCSGIISTITRKSSSVHGLYRYKLTAQKPDGLKSIDAFLKLKASSRQLEETGLKVARLTGEDSIPGLYESQSHIFCIEKSHLRELKIYSNADRKLLNYCPKIYGTKVNHQREIYAVLMEDLTGTDCYDSIDSLHSWKDEGIKIVLRDMGAMHAIYFDKYTGLKKMDVQRLEQHFVCSSSELLKELTRFNTMRYPELIPGRIREIYESFLENLENNVDKMLSFPQTLTHNDFNPRNLCIRRSGKVPETVLYDWELAIFQNPQHDLIEFLVFVLGENSSRSEYLRYADFYLKNLEKAVGRSFSRKHFIEILDLNALFFALVRMNLYLLGHNILNLGFLERVYRNLTGYIDESFGDASGMADIG